MDTSAHGQVQYLNPEQLVKNPAFTNVVTVTGPVKTVYIGGQDAVDASGNIVGKGDLARQTEQVFANLRTALHAGGADLEHVIKWNVYVVQGHSLQSAYEVFRNEWGLRSNPPVISVMIVSGLANPDFLVEIDAVAVVPQQQAGGA